jgi:heme-degrading monooxygenase HmoA
MFIAMNRFQVVKGHEEDFEQVWRSRDTYLDNVPGFVQFELLKGPEAEFEAWTRSEAFRAAHQHAGEHKPLYLGHPQFEGFEVRQVISGAPARSKQAAE